MTNYSAVLFDVDGTLVDSGPVVVECFQKALSDMGMPPLNAEGQRKIIGPPLGVSFNLIAGVPTEAVEEAISIYRSYYRERFLEPALYPGIAELLKNLHTAGIPIATATTKVEALAEQQLQHLGLDQYFDVIAGATDDPHHTKVKVVADALRRLADKGLDTTSAVLVGDREFDVEGAELNDLPLIVADWGYGVPEEFVSPAVAAHAKSPSALQEMLLD